MSSGVLPAAEGAPVSVAAVGPTVVASAGQAVEVLVSTLSGRLVPVAGLPTPNVAVLRVSDRTLGVGNSRGLEEAGPFSAVELHGGRIEGVVQFQVWGTDSVAANSEMTALQDLLLTARADLWGAGFDAARRRRRDRGRRGAGVVDAYGGLPGVVRVPARADLGRRQSDRLGADRREAGRRVR